MTPWRRRDVMALSSRAGLVVAAGTMRGTGAAEHPHQHGVPRPGSSSEFEQNMDQSMTGMMQDMHASPYSGDPDVDFLAMMIPHHQGAIDMARLVLQHGRDPVTRQLAEEIIAGQSVEIDSMQGRLALLRMDVCTTEEEFPALGGTRGP